MIFFFFERGFEKWRMEKGGISEGGEILIKKIVLKQQHLNIGFFSFVLFCLKRVYYH